MVSFRGQFKLELYSHKSLVGGFNFNFPTSIPVLTSKYESPPPPPATESWPFLGNGSNFGVFENKSFEFTV